ncbi:MAG: nucleotidyltransferase substrate binding protein [Mariprofundaceae bacterium]|nr:nucleotidyltransferase substrate binding protein [Mariprofundaceae bacterium]
MNQQASDIRWIQRLNSFEKALANLSEAIELNHTRSLSKLEEQGLIKAFELVHEQAWLTLKDYFEFMGDNDIHGSRDAFRLAFKRGLIEQGDVFMQSIRTRQLSVHTYNESTAEKIHADILHVYFQAFQTLLKTMQALQSKVV